MCEFNWQTIQFTCKGEFLEPYLIKTCATPSKKCSMPHKHNNTILSTVACKEGCKEGKVHVVLNPPTNFPRLKPGALHT